MLEDKTQMHQLILAFVMSVIIGASLFAMAQLAGPGSHHTMKEYEAAVGEESELQYPVDARPADAERLGDGRDARQG
jgi:hypothetical protein